MNDAYGEWELFRHKTNPEVAYWARFEEDAVAIRSPRNVMLDAAETMKDAEMSVFSGFMPKKAFMELYERVER